MFLKKLLQSALFLFGENCDIWMQFFVCMFLPPYLAIEHAGLYRYDWIII